ncbi:hypothetical protein ACQKPX_22900 [Photobacterium sp. DNB23_23_1]
MLVGVAASFIGASFQSINYALTQNYQYNKKIDSIKLLLATHAFMGIIALIITLTMGYAKHFDYRLLWDLVKVNAPYIAAQFFLIRAITESDSSVVSPLLALKIPALAMISILYFNNGYGFIQWVSILAIVVISGYFSFLSGTVSIKPLLLIFATCLGYGLSDIAISILSHKVIAASVFEQSLITICMNYLFCGLLTLPFLNFYEVNVNVVFSTKWIASAWFISVFFLVIGFNLSGVVYGNVIQSLRGVIGVAIAYIFLRHQINQSNIIWKKKFIGAIGMLAAVALFYV